MRKYIRLLLFAIAFSSFVLMFVYRHKYSELSTLFEMLNTFQFKSSKVKCDEKFYEFQALAKYNFSTQEMITNMPYWTEIFPSIYAYSSYWLSGRTRTFIFSRNASLRVLDKIVCKLWYESDKNAKITNAKYFLVKEKRTSLFLFLECIPSLTHEVPHSISFIYRNMTMPFVLPVIYQNSYVGNHGLYALCVKPLLPGFGDVYKILEFIIFHSHIGVKTFIFYDTGMSLNVKRLLLEIGTKTGTYILLLKWNPPFGLQGEFYFSDIYFIDCIHHVNAKNYTNLILKLDIERFIVPKVNLNLNEPIKLFDNLLSVEEKKFCLEFPNDIIAHNLNIPFVTLLKTKVSNTPGVVSNVIFDATKLRKSIDSEFRVWFFKNHMQMTGLVPKSSVIHSYVKCGLNESEKMYSIDKTMWNYKDVFYKSEIYELAKIMSLVYD